MGVKRGKSATSSWGGTTPPPGAERFYFYPPWIPASTLLSFYPHPSPPPHTISLLLLFHPTPPTPHISLLLYLPIFSLRSSYTPSPLGVTPFLCLFPPPPPRFTWLVWIATDWPLCRRPHGREFMMLYTKYFACSYGAPLPCAGDGEPLPPDSTIQINSPSRTDSPDQVYSTRRCEHSASFGHPF